jgi:glycosyltransferase involved in cell wall biosynthesis
LEFYRNHYVGDGSTWFSYFFNKIADFAFPVLYYIPLTIFAACVGIPSKTADFYVFDYSRRVHVLKSGMDTDVFHPSAAKYSSNLESTDIDRETESPETLQGEIFGTDTTHEDCQTDVSINIIQTPQGKGDYDIKNVRTLAGKGSENGPILVYCGRLAKEKNIEFLIRSMANPLLKDATLLIVGGGPLRGELEALAIETVGGNYIYSQNLNVF